MNSYQAWQRLVAAAREAPVEPRPVEMSPGFATRVVARAWERRPSTAAVFERMALRALGCAACVMLLSVGWGLSAPTANALEDSTVELLDPVGEALALVQT